MLFFALLLAVVLCIILLMLYFVFMFDMVFFGHDLTTTRRAQKVIYGIIRTYAQNASIFYDAGCARGSFSLSIKKAMPHLAVHSIDNSALRLFFAKMRAFASGQEITWQKADILNIDLGNADVIYAYLWHDIMPQLEKKLQKELKNGALVITNTTHFSEWQPIETHIIDQKKPYFEKLFVYVKQ